jgi:ribonuclease Z
MISGDTRYSTNLEKAASGADLLVCEVAMIPEKLFDKYPVCKAIHEHHISPEQVGKLFTASRQKWLFTHLWYCPVFQRRVFPSPHRKTC